MSELSKAAEKLLDQLVSEPISRQDLNEAPATYLKPSESHTASILSQLLKQQEHLEALRECSDDAGVVSARGQAQALIGQLAQKYNQAVLMNIIGISCPDASEGALKRFQGVMAHATGIPVIVQDAGSLYQYLADSVQAGFVNNGRITVDMFDEIFSRMQALVPVLGMRPIVPAQHLVNMKCVNMAEVRRQIRGAVDRLDQVFRAEDPAAVQPVGYIHMRGQVLEKLLQAKASDEALVIFGGEMPEIIAFAPTLCRGKILNIELPGRNKIDQKFAAEVCDRLKAEIVNN